MGLNKNIIDFIVNNIDEILEIKEIREAIINHDIRKQNERSKRELNAIKNAKINLEEQKKCLRKYEERVIKTNSNESYKLYIDDLIANYLYTLKINGINPTTIPYEDIIKYGNILVDSLREKNYKLNIDLNEEKSNEFYNEYNETFNKLDNGDTEVIKDISTTELSKKFHSYLPPNIMVAIIDKKTMEKAVSISNNKVLVLNNKKNS